MHDHVDRPALTFQLETAGWLVGTAPAHCLERNDRDTLHQPRDHKLNTPET